VLEAARGTIALADRVSGHRVVSQGFKDGRSLDGQATEGAVAKALSLQDNHPKTQRVIRHSNKASTLPYLTRITSLKFIAIAPHPEFTLHEFEPPSGDTNISHAKNEDETMQEIVFELDTVLLNRKIRIQQPWNTIGPNSR
jgi:hypothetical protein